LSEGNQAARSNCSSSPQALTCSHATVPHIVALLGFHLPPSHLGNSSELDCSRFVVGWFLLSRCKDRQKWLIFQINPRLFSDFLLKALLFPNYFVESRGSPDHIQESDISMLYYLSHSHFI
jgi:hypothetical protein